MKDYVIEEIVAGPDARDGMERLSRQVCDYGIWNGAMQRLVAERLLCGLLTYTVYCEGETRYRLSFIYDLLTNMNAFLCDEKIESDDGWDENTDSGLSSVKSMIFRAANSIELLYEDRKIFMGEAECIGLKKGWCDLIHSAGYRDDVLDRAASGLEEALDLALSGEMHREEEKTVDCI